MLERVRIVSVKLDVEQTSYLRSPRSLEPTRVVFKSRHNLIRKECGYDLDRNASKDIALLA